MDHIGKNNISPTHYHIHVARASQPRAPRVQQFQPTVRDQVNISFPGGGRFPDMRMMYGVFPQPPGFFPPIGFPFPRPIFPWPPMPGPINPSPGPIAMYGVFPQPQPPMPGPIGPSPGPIAMYGVFPVPGWNPQPSPIGPPPYTMKYGVFV